MAPNDLSPSAGSMDRRRASHHEKRDARGMILRRDGDFAHTSRTDPLLSRTAAPSISDRATMDMALSGDAASNEGKPFHLRPSLSRPPGQWPVCGAGASPTEDPDGREIRGAFVPVSRRGRGVSRLISV